ncbi:type IV secretion system DNA-binding domain-containing protein [Patescibacteria group bacterium]|nr:type IV secretion system DNA-binding domain-containing protein [Patescibacteria group bacterium]MBU1663357.1 type IV secretion system DNA-binding domain-containing protein [Patescibacteria group bacterium]MBU1934354.1 type IV secretion system DNA-binding domain-containing protein [Patescibacteria group bacterium]MBU2007922.1 type IV secretion system DNA-binding domain-containing protein [Patescibacteria group bacterium]MBU2233713.1 type IV secretion system DNA-binding domain-containing prote
MDYGLSGQNTQVINNISLNVNIDGWLIYLLVAVVFIILLFILRKIILLLALNSKYHDHVIYLLRVPKEKPNEKEQQNTQNYLQHLREEISRGETIFKAIGGLKAERWYKNFTWLIGRNDHFSFEIVANHKYICFYVVAPIAMGRYIEQQIQAFYPEAVLEQVPDYNIFSARGKTVASFIKTRRSFIFPLKTYNKMEADPINSLVNAMSKLGEDESLAIQYVVRSSSPGWHNKVNQVVSSVNQGKKLSEALSSNLFSKILIFFSDLINTAKPNAQARKPEKENRLTAMEQEVLKLIEEKNSKAGLDVNIRIVASARDLPRAKVFLNNMISVFSQYNYYQYGNIFSNKIPFYNNYIQKFLVKDFIYRRFKPSLGLILNTEELASLYHPPLSGAETPNILWLLAKYSSAPSNIPNQGIILGKNIYRGITTEIKMKREDRRRHTYIIGKSGAGKSVLLAAMAIQDIINGEGVCVIDPHGDLIDDIISRVPPERADDVILFAPADIERPLALNLLEFDPRYPEQKTFVINEMIKIFDKLYDLKATGGPIFEQYMRNAMLLIMSDLDSGSTLMEIPKVLADSEFRKMKLGKCKDPTVVDFWRKEAEKAGGEAALANVVPYITSKLTSFISNDTMRPIIARQKSSFNLRDVMDSRKILLVDLSKGLIGEMNAHLLGMILVGKILMSALSRTDMSQGKRVDFYLYIDEFQNFTTDSVTSILSEARKYNLNLIIAHQYLGQLVKNQDTSIKNAVFGNVGTWLLFKIGSEDAETMAKEFAPVFNQYDLINIEKYTTYVKLLVDNTASRPFSMSTVWPLPGVKRQDLAAKIKSLSRLKYGQDRNIIEAEIFSRIKQAEK